MDAQKKFVSGKSQSESHTIQNKVKRNKGFEVTLVEQVYQHQHLSSCLEVLQG